LLEYLEYVVNQIDAGDPVDVIYLDFQKAFDKVPHCRLLQTIIVAVDRRSRVSTSIFTSGRSHQYLWSNNSISCSSLCCYIAR